MIYAIQAGEFVKIGYAKNVSKRVKTLQVGSAVPIVVLATCHGDRSTEKAFHLMLRNSRVRGEWFEVNDDTNRAVMMIRNGEHPPILKDKEKKKIKLKEIPFSEYEGVSFEIEKFRIGLVSCNIPPSTLAVMAGLGINTLRNLNNANWNPTRRTLNALEMALRKKAMTNLDASAAK